MSQVVANIHNHTPFSDGAYTIDELCEAHLKLDPPVRGVGVSDHLFCTPSSREVKSEREFERLFAAEKRDYVEMVNDARRRWAGKLHIYCGAEVNWPLNKNMLPSIIKMLDGVDYVLFEFTDWAGLTTLANQSRRFPCPVGLSRTDVAEQFPSTSMDQVVRTLANARIFYEISPRLGGLTPENPWFRILPNHKVRVAIGTDTHDDLSVLSEIASITDYVQEMGLADRLFLPDAAEEAVAK